MSVEIPCNCSRAGLGWAAAHLCLVGRSDPCPSCSWPPHSSSALQNTDVYPYRKASHSFLLSKGMNTTAQTYVFLPPPPIVADYYPEQFDAENCQASSSKKFNHSIPIFFRRLFHNLLQAAFFSRWLKTVF